MLLGFWVSAVLLFIGGAAFCLLVTLPYGVHFLGVNFPDTWGLWHFS